MVVKRLPTLREIMSLKISILQRKLEEYLATKTSYDNFSYTDLRAIKVASCELCTLVNVFDTVKEKWKKEVERLKLVYVDCFSTLSS